MFPFKFLSRRKYESICNERARLRNEVARLKKKNNELSSLAFRGECLLYIEQGGTYQVFRMDSETGRPVYLRRETNMQWGIPHASRFH